MVDRLNAVNLPTLDISAIELAQARPLHPPLATCLVLVHAHACVCVDPFL